MIAEYQKLHKTIVDEYECMLQHIQSLKDQNNTLTYRINELEENIKDLSCVSSIVKAKNDNISLQTENDLLKITICNLQKTIKECKHYNRSTNTMDSFKEKEVDNTNTMDSFKEKEVDNTNTMDSSIKEKEIEIDNTNTMDSSIKEKEKEKEIEIDNTNTMDIEIFEITFKKKKYYVDQERNDVYAILSNGDIGKKLGMFSSSVKNGKKRNKIVFD